MTNLPEGCHYRTEQQGQACRDGTSVSISGYGARVVREFLCADGLFLTS